MENITPQQIRVRAVKAHTRMKDLFVRAGVAKPTFWRWEKGLTASPNPVTVQKLIDALDDIERERGLKKQEGL
jgi:transcriptional regulator with XRE-family HTH domain